MSKRVELAFQRIIDHVEPLTRFDRSSLIKEGGSERDVAARASWRFTPAFPVHETAGNGPLPPSVTNAVTATQLETSVHAALTASKAKLRARLERWLSINGGNDRALENTDCFDPVPPLGYQYPCPDCSGRGRVQCPACSGAGQMECKPCGATGYLDCRPCRGSGKVTCNACKGRGQLSSGQRCAKKVTCPGCNGDAKVGHRECGTTGKITCDRCAGATMIVCECCGGAGVRHVIRTISCNVTDEFRVEISDENRDVVRTIQRRDLRALRAIAATIQRTPHLENDVITREYDILCPIAELTVRAGGVHPRLTAFGTRAVIDDFKLLVQSLLTADLHDLEQTVAQSRIRLWNPSAALRDAVSRCLASEANVRVAAEGREAQDLEREHSVTRVYSSRLRAALHKALRRLYVAEAGVMAIALTLVPVALFLSIHLSGVGAPLGPWLFPAVLLAGIVAWIVPERRAHRRFLNMFGAAPATVDRIAQRRHLFIGVRLIAAAIATVLVGVAGYLTWLEPPVDFGTQTAHDTTIARAALPAVPDPFAAGHTVCIANETGVRIAYEAISGSDVKADAIVSGVHELPATTGTELAIRWRHEDAPAFGPPVKVDATLLNSGDCREMPAYAFRAAADGTIRLERTLPPGFE